MSVAFTLFGGLPRKALIGLLVLAAAWALGPPAGARAGLETVASCEGCRFGPSAIDLSRGYPVILSVLVAGENDEYNMGLLFTKPLGSPSTARSRESCPVIPGADIRTEATGWVKTELPLGDGNTGRPPAGVGLSHGDDARVWSWLNLPGGGGGSSAAWSFWADLDGAGNVQGRPAGEEYAAPWDSSLLKMPIVVDVRNKSVDVVWEDADGNLRATTFKDGSFRTQVLGPAPPTRDGTSPWDLGYYPDKNAEMDYPCGMAAYYTMVTGCYTFTGGDPVGGYRVDDGSAVTEAGKEALDAATDAEVSRGDETLGAVISTPDETVQIKGLNTENPEVTHHPRPGTGKQIMAPKRGYRQSTADPGSVSGEFVAYDPATGSLTVFVRRKDARTGLVDDGVAELETYSPGMTLLDVSESADGDLHLLVKYADESLGREVLSKETLDPDELGIIWY